MTAPAKKVEICGISGHLEHFPRREVAQENGAGLTREEKRTAMLAQTLPRGITIGWRSDGREKPWFVRFGAKRATESFTGERARNDRAQELAGSVQTEGAAVLDFDPAEWRKVQRFKERTGISIEEAEEIVLRVRGNLRLNLTVREAAAKYLAMRTSEGLPALSAIHPRLHLKRFCEQNGALPLFSITAEHVRTWMDALRAAKLSEQTVKHHRKNVNVFFERAVMEKWCVENPCAAVTPPRVEDKDTTVATPAEVFALLSANRDEPVVAGLALELFGFLRCSSVERITAEHLRTASRGIELPGRQHKSGKRKFRQGHAPVLWEWLGYAADAFFADITEKNYDERKKAAFIRAKVPLRHNILRHSCASYALAVTKNLPFVSYMMQHSSLAMTERYEGVAEEHDARLVLSMTPAAVLLPFGKFTTRWVKFHQPFPTTPKP